MRVRVHAALFPNVRLLAVSEQSTRSATLTVAVTHPGTNAHNCCLGAASKLKTGQTSESGRTGGGRTGVVGRPNLLSGFVFNCFFTFYML